MKGATWIGLSTLVLGPAALALSAPQYFTSAGFPTDASWVNLCYGRTLATHAMLGVSSYEASAGVPSVAWALLLAIPHLLGLSFAGVLLTTKLIGMGFHVLTGALVYGAARAAAPERPRTRWLAVGLVSLHPSLLVMSASGLPTPVGTAHAAALLLAVFGGRLRLFVALAVTAPFILADSTLLAMTLPVFYFGRHDRRCLLRFGIGGVVGSALGWAALAARNALSTPVSISPALGADFGAGAGDYWVRASVLLGEIPLLDATVGWLILASVLGYLWLRQTEATVPVDGFRAAAAAGLAAAAQVPVAFALHTPDDPGSLVSRATLVVALPALAFALAWAADRLADRLEARHRVVALAIGGLLVLETYALGFSKHIDKLVSDSHGMDQRSVAAGLMLSDVPSHMHIWVVEPGAVCYLAGGRCFDTSGVHSNGLLGVDPAGYVAGRPPTILQVVPGLSGVDQATAQHATARTFEAPEGFSASARPQVGVQHLVGCVPQTTGAYLNHWANRKLNFRCRGDGAEPPEQK